MEARVSKISYYTISLGWVRTEEPSFLFIFRNIGAILYSQCPLAEKKA